MFKINNLYTTMYKIIYILLFMLAYASNTDIILNDTNNQYQCNGIMCYVDIVVILLLLITQIYVNCIYSCI